MTEKRLILAALPLALLAACQDEAPDEGAASGEVLEGSISDEMLPVDTVRSEPPLEDPEAFREVQDDAADPAPAAEGEEAADQEEAASPGSDLDDEDSADATADGGAE